MKKFFVIAAAALALVACNKEQKFEAEPQAEAIPVAFDSYLNRNVDTKAGTPGRLDILALQLSSFGVFAYYTDGNEYDSNSVPNFMYNQEVLYNVDHWEYAPVKYWPNEYGKNAIAEERDKVSFFAYAPYVKVTPSNGKIDGDVTLTTWGITGMTRNTATGDPMVKYMVSLDPNKSVDLLWGVADATADVTWKTSFETDDQTIAKGMPWLNVERPKTAADQKLKFDFHHALAQLNVQIDADPDAVSHNTNAIAAKTKVYVRSITFTGFAMKGALNLNNTEAAKPYWKDYAGVDDLMYGEEVTIYDGRKDGKEGVADAVATNEKVLGLNPVIIQKETATAGVTTDPVNLFNSATLAKPFFVIPTGEKVDVTIVYDVETEDENLAGYLSDGKTPGSSVQNTITKKAVFAKLENDKAYTLKIHLGLTSVKFDADVTEWTAVTPATDTDLPANF